MAYAPTYKDPVSLYGPGASRRTRASFDDGLLRREDTGTGAVQPGTVGARLVKNPHQLSGGGHNVPHHSKADAPAMVLLNISIYTQEAGKGKASRVKANRGVQLDGLGTSPGERALEYAGLERQTCAALTSLWVRRRRNGAPEGVSAAGNCAGLEEADRAEDDFEELKRAALDGLSTKRRLRTAVLPVDDGAHEAVDVKKLGRSQRAQLVSKVPRASSRSASVSACAGGVRWRRLPHGCASGRASKRW